MTRSPHEGRRFLLPGGLLGMVALVALVEGSLRHHDASFSAIAPENWKYSRWAARHEAPRAEILCLGNSIAKYALQPLVIEARTGKTAFNLAMCGSPTPGMYFVLRRALEAGARPAALLIAFDSSPLSAAHKGPHPALGDSRRLWPELLRLDEVTELAWSCRDAEFFARTAASLLLPSYKARFEVRKQIVASLRGEDPPSLAHLIAAYRNWRLNRGAMAYPPNPEVAARPSLTPPVAPDAPRSELTPGSFQRDWLWEDYTLRTLDLAAARGIAVFWIVAPLSPEREIDHDRSGLNDYVTRLARFVQAHHPDLVVIDGRRSGYPRTAFMADGVHMDVRGARAFSGDVADVVRRHLARPGSAPRRVDLPAFREPSDALPMEDYAQSLLAVQPDVKTARR